MHTLGTTSLTITVHAAAPKHQSDKFVYRTFIDGAGVDSVGWSQRAIPAYVAVIRIILSPYTLTSRMHTSSAAVFDQVSGFNLSAHWHVTEEDR
jgi:hypothetical protein